MAGLPLRDLIQVQWGGAVGTSERWATGLWFEQFFSATPTQAQSDAFAASVLGYFSTVWTQLKGRNAAGVTYDSVKVHIYRNNVLTTSSTASQAPVAGIGTAPNPGYTARCVSLITGVAGRSHRGRMYLPWTGVAVSGTTLQWSSDAAVIPALKTMLASIAANTDLPVTGNVSAVVVSRAGPAPDVITSLRMDSIPDTQHGRTRKMTAVATDTTAIP